MYHVMERDTNHVLSDLLNYGTKGSGSFMDITAIVIAGGRSSRMGTNKALLQVGDLPVIERLVQNLEEITSKIILVSNESAPYEYLGKEIIPDVYTQAGPLAGIHAGLSASGTTWNLVTACDMPFMDARVLRCLKSEAERSAKEGPALSDIATEAVIPRTSSGILPLLAMYKRSVLQGLESALEEQQLRLIPWTETLQAKYIPAEVLSRESGVAEELLGFNMNRPSDYEQACLLFEQTKRED